MYICTNDFVMAYNSNRKEDSRLELIVNEFLDDYFYSKEFDKAKWVIEKEEQLKGIDVYLTSEKHGLNEAKVDVKSAVTCSTRYLPTFSLELSFIGRRGGEKIGWFLNEDLDTEYCLLIYPRSQKYYTEMELKDDIDYIDYYLVKKSDLVKFFESRGYDKERLKKVSDEMRAEYAKTGGDKLSWDSDSENFHFVLSGKLAEKPVNAVVKRQVYEKYAIMKGRIEKNGIH